MLECCAVYDSAVEAYLTPLFVVHVGQAVRSFKDEASREGSPIAAHPDHYDLYRIGSFDEQSGTLLALPKPALLCIGNSIRDSS